MNWGWKITIVYLLFAGGIMTLVMKSRAHKVDLVVPDYYQQELAYETRLNAMRNLEALSKRPEVILSEGTVQVTFPSELNAVNTRGNINLYRPSDVNDDKKVTLQLNESNQQEISTSGMNPGLYMMQLSWTADNKEYYTEQTVYLK